MKLCKNYNYCEIKIFENFESTSNNDTNDYEQISVNLVKYLSEPNHYISQFFFLTLNVL